MEEMTPQRAALVAVAVLVVLAIGWRSMDHGGGAGGTYSGAPRAEPAPAPAPLVVVVDVVGAVRRPGVYRLPDGARVEDAVRRAVAAPAADLGALNLAARLADGEQVVVPRRGAHAAAVAAGAGTQPQIVHLNSASQEQLETLDGIGPSLAQRIIDYREQHGGFRSLAELDQVSGFGPARMAALHGHVAL